MTFSGLLKIKGRKDERIELRCSFDRSQLWTCGNMFPVDEKVAQERRLQATVNCLDSDRCQFVGLQLYVSIDGKVETQLFQSHNFSIRQADSGDALETEDHEPVTPAPVKPKPQAPPKFQGRLPREKAPAPEKPIPGEGIELGQETKLPEGVESFESEEDVNFEPPPLTEEELDQLLGDPNAAVEIEPPVWTPEPDKGQYSIPGIEKLSASVGKGVRSQAFGSHTKGHLQKASQLPASGPGFTARVPLNHAYGADLMMEMLKGAAASVAKAYPGKSPFVIASISKQTGGTLLNRSGRAHASHKNGLDVDVVFPASKPVKDMWNVCTYAKGGCGRGARISNDFDTERFWQFAKAMTCADNNPVRVMFLDAQIKRHLCEYVRKQPSEKVDDPNSCAHKTLKAMKHSAGHHNHVHIRLRCPGNRECQERTFDLGRGTGC